MNVNGINIASCNDEAILEQLVSMQNPCQERRQKSDTISYLIEISEKVGSLVIRASG